MNFVKSRFQSMFNLNHLYLVLQKGSQKADEYVRMIKDKLELAVEQCIEAAGHEWEPQTQKALLRASLIFTL